MLLALILAVVLEPAAAPPVDATKLMLTDAKAIVEIDAGKMKGDIIRLAWSPKNDECYLQTAQQDGRGNVILRHYVMDLKGQQPKERSDMPEWAQSYWQWKSAQSAPGIAAFKIVVEQQQKRMTATSTPTGGDLAKGGLDSGGGRGGGATTIGDATGAAQQSQMANIVTLRLKGEVVGEFVNAPALPGTTFGWGPTGTGLIAYVTSGGSLSIMDEQSRKVEVPGTKNVSQPAWTADGKRLAYLEKTGRNKFTLRAVEVMIPVS